MSAVLLLCGLAVWLGAMLVLADRRWWSRAPLTERLERYVIGRRAASSVRRGAFSVTSLADVIGPLASDLGGKLAGLLGVREPLAARLARLHDDVDPTVFRLRQLSASAIGLAVAGVVVAIASPKPIIALGIVVLAPGIMFALLEQQIAARDLRRQQRVFAELPVIAEQIGMLLSSGWSLGASLQRVATRSPGAVGQDLDRVCVRMQHGLSEQQALLEWSDTAGVDVVERLVAVLIRNRETTDLGEMITTEAAAMRADAHRQLLMTLEKRAQMVWIPVTISTLIPGTIFMAIPFIEVLRVFTSR